MPSTLYDVPIEALAERERWHRWWHSGTDVRLVGSGCFLGALVLAAYGALRWPHAVQVFGATVDGPKATLLWAVTLGLLLGMGYGLTFQQRWGWDLAVTTMGFLTVSESMNTAVSGVTFAGVGALLVLVLLAAYLLWRRDVVPAIDETTSSGRSRRGRRR